MAFEIPSFTLGTQKANADLSSSQYLAVVINSSGNVAVAGAGADIAGILQNKPTAGHACDVCVDGVSKAVAGGSVTAGAKLMTNASGQLITATATNKAVGIALDSASGAGVVIPVLLKDLGTQ